ncbi:MAG TPA: hypothetical protein VJ020_09655 [Anaerolineales bacterium]|nr:hypothetical protein [Anaerolineales bacterium]
MKNTDKFLIGIVAGVALLVVVAFAVALLRPKPAYQPEDTPEGVTHNYLFALQEKDYERAYTYLSPTLAGYPDSSEEFVDNIDEYQWSFGYGNDSTTLEVESTDITGSRAVVTVRETTFYEGGLFDSGQYSNTFKVKLRLNAPTGTWQITESDSYWVWCWNDNEGCS